MWAKGPEWPISRSTGVPMRFICQIALDDLAVGNGYEGKLAYLFMTDVEIRLRSGGIKDVLEQYQTDGGENAVILQPGGDRLVETKPIIRGPTLCQSFAAAYGVEAVAEDEYLVDLASRRDPDYVPTSQILKMPAIEREAYCGALKGNKLGGVPGWVQSDELPFGVEQSKLILQLDQGRVPFFVDFGDVGVGYLFVKVPGDQARFLFQCT